jgi:hypothetical protein
MSNQGAVELTRKDLVDVMLKLADASWKSMDTRRAYEWKVSFGLWAGLGALAGFLLKGQASPLASWQCWEVVIAALGLVIVAAVHIFVWIRAVHERNHNDVRRAHHYWHMVEANCGLPITHEDRLEQATPSLWGDWAHCSQIVVTMVFAAFAIAGVLSKVI